MNGLELSLIEAHDHILDGVQVYAQSRQLEIDIEHLNWGNVRDRLRNYALYGKGPDVSAMGCTWVGNFAHMDALRALPADAAGEKEFFPQVNWITGTSGQNVHAIPFTSDVRVLYFRRDLFAQAGIDEASAFATIPDMEDTFQRLKDFCQTQENIIPFVIPTVQELILLQNAAMWVWHAGGRFMSADGWKTRFSEPSALAGLGQHFKVFGSAIVPEGRNLTQVQCGEVFNGGRAAACIAGSWMLSGIYDKSAAPVVLENLGIARLPIPTFVGGQSLAVWKHAKNDLEARNLIRYLVRPETQYNIFRHTSELPARIDILKNPDFMDPYYADAFLYGIETGRGFSAQYMWGTTEDRLLPALRRLWQMVFEDPELDIAKSTARIFVPLAKVVDRMLGGGSMRS